MLKYANINRTSRAQQAFQLQRQCTKQVSENENHIDPSLVNNEENQYSSSSPQPSLASAPESPLSKLNSSKQSYQSSPIKCNDSMLKIFATSLSQDVEYITLHVNSQTKCQQIIKSLLKKFRLKHRDPNLFYLTLERWIRKDGLKFKSVMLLGDEACPLQLQQCCSNPPHNDIKFTLQMRNGALVKIFCSDVVPDARYKCLSLSTQTTVDETIELILHCLNLTNTTTTTTQTAKTTIVQDSGGRRLAGSPSSTGSSSSNSSSSGIESEPTNTNCKRLDSDSRASSITSISSASNSSLASHQVDQFCLVIECKDSSFRRILEPHEYLVDVYQNLLAEFATRETQNVANEPVSEQPKSPFSPKLPRFADLASVVSMGSLQRQTSTSSVTNTDQKIHSHPQKPDQWFFIKLRRREDCITTASAIKFIQPRQNMPLPPIPVPVFSDDEGNERKVKHFVSTPPPPPPPPVTQIEIRHGRSASSLAIGPPRVLSAKRALFAPSPAAALGPLQLPPIQPRRRNLSNASTTFRPSGSNGTLSRRRYDPAQLAEDLSKLDIGCSSKPFEVTPG